MQRILTVSSHVHARLVLALAAIMICLIWPGVNNSLPATGRLLATPANEVAPDEENEFKEAISKAWQKTKLPGAVIAVYRMDRPPLIAVVGLADVQNNTPMTADCHFRIGSISKVFLGTAVLTLIDEGKISGDDTIDKYVAGVPNGDRITLRHLANHRAGLFNIIESKTIKEKFSAEPEKWWDEKELLEFALKSPVYFEPGQGHHYSNAHSLLLAKLLEKVTGRPWPDEVTKRVIQPLGLRNTSIARSKELPTPFARGYALGGDKTPFFVRGDRLYDVTNTSPSWWGAAGSVISTATDLGKAAKPLATGSLLKEKGRRELHAWTKADQPGYEYGFHIEKVDGMIGHDGDVPGYQCAMYYDTVNDATLIGLGNLYGWSVRGMPTNVLLKVARIHVSSK